MECYLIKEGFEKLYNRGAIITLYIADADSATREILRNGLDWGDKI
jgi:hypothetical protein